MIFILLHVVQNQWSSQSRSVRSAATVTPHCKTIQYISAVLKAYLTHLLIWPVQCKALLFLFFEHLILCGIERVQLTSERVILCSAVQRGIKRVHLTSSSSWCRAQPCSHGNCEQVQDTQLFQSLIMPILFSHLLLLIIIRVTFEQSSCEMLGPFQLLNVKLKQTDSSISRRDYIFNTNMLQVEKCSLALCAGLIST